MSNKALSNISKNNFDGDNLINQMDRNVIIRLENDVTQLKSEISILKHENSALKQKQQIKPDARSLVFLQQLFEKIRYIENYEK